MIRIESMAALGYPMVFFWNEQVVRIIAYLNGGRYVDYDFREIYQVSCNARGSSLFVA